MLKVDGRANILTSILFESLTLYHKLELRFKLGFYHVKFRNWIGQFLDSYF